MSSLKTSLRAAAGIFVFSSLSFLGATSVMTGCSDDSSGETAEAGPEQCPTNITAAQGAACTTERMTCSLSYDCAGGDPLRETAECTCTSNAWSCVDPKGNAVPQGQVPACTSTGTGNDKDCPATETEGATCHTQGLVCSYQGLTCPNSSTPLTDTCQCLAFAEVDGGTGYSIHCEPGQCPVPLGEAGPPGDAGSD